MTSEPTRRGFLQMLGGAIGLLVGARTAEPSVERPAPKRVAEAKLVRYGQVMHIPLENIIHRTGPRETFPSTKLMDAMMGSIERNGMVMPVTVAPTRMLPGYYDVADGMLRVHAARALGLTHILCQVIPQSEIQLMQLRANQCRHSSSRKKRKATKSSI